MRLLNLDVDHVINLFCVVCFGFLYATCLYQIFDTWDVDDDSTQELYKYVVMLLIFGSF